MSAARDRDRNRRWNIPRSLREQNPVRARREAGVVDRDAGGEARGEQAVLVVGEVGEHGGEKRMVCRRPSEFCRQTKEWTSFARQYIAFCMN